MRNLVLSILMVVAIALPSLAHAGHARNENSGKAKVTCKIRGSKEKLTKNVKYDEAEIAFNSADGDIEVEFFGLREKGNEELDVQVDFSLEGITQDQVVAMSKLKGNSDDYEFIAEKVTVAEDDSETGTVVLSNPVDSTDPSVKLSASGTLKIKKITEDKISGNFKVKYPRTVALSLVDFESISDQIDKGEISEDEAFTSNPESSVENGAVTVTCKFKNVDFFVDSESEDDDDEEDEEDEEEVDDEDSTDDSTSEDTTDDDSSGEDGTV